MIRDKKSKRKEFNRRYDAIKNLMSTFAMSTVAVVAVVTLIPTSPKAEIIRVETLSEQVTYQVNVTDQDQALDESSLFVVLENQMEYYEQPISLGENSGYFDALSPDTDYRLSVYGSKGFGQERLDTLMVKTRATVGATILAINKTSLDYFTSYTVDILIYDPDDIYQSITLYYGYLSEYETLYQYESIQVLDDRSSIEITDIYTKEPIHFYIEAMSNDGLIVLDEMWVTPPFTFYSSMYFNYATNQAIYLSLYNEMVDDLDVTYTLYIYNENDVLLRSELVDLSLTSFQDVSVYIGDLTPSTIYHIICEATYINPQTLRTEDVMIYDDILETLSDYQLQTFVIQEYDTYYEVYIVLDDPSNYFDSIYVELYDVSGDYMTYIQSDTYMLIINQDLKTISFTITKPPSQSYQLTIMMQSTSNYEIRDIIYDHIYE
ncbi:MAG: hypothetical protein AB7E61_06985 [Acholeplasmataceae bacterium]